MTFAVVGLLVSAAFLALIEILFLYERNTGRRVAENVRVHADLFVLQATHSIHKTLRYIARDFIKQVGHYLFHTILKTILAFITRMEKWVRGVMRVNKTLAKHAERESSTRNKLEEVALHKAKHALSEEEKKKYRERSLKGL